MDFQTELTKYVQKVEQELTKYIVVGPCPEQKLNQAIEYSLMSGGKRLRPVLILATYHLFKQEDEVCLPYAVAMEMVHNFSLIHDDLPGIDNDDFRHGKPTNHKKFGESTAILAGDSLLNMAYKVIAQDLKKFAYDKKRIRILEEFSEAIERMIAGEYVDTEYEGKKISAQYLEYMHQNKTGQLIREAVRMGAILGEATEEQIEKLSIYAEKIGLAFQIRDDILSEIGNEKTLGKPVGNDRKREKCTYVTKYGLEEAQTQLEQITKQAKQIMSTFGPNGAFLEQLALYLEKREK